MRSFRAGAAWDAHSRADTHDPPHDGRHSTVIFPQAVDLHEEFGA